MNAMFRKSLLCAASLMFAACGQVEEGETFRDGLPSKEMVEVKTPAREGQGLTAAVDAFAQGQQSEAYAWTRGATVVVNGGTVAVLTLIKEITEHAPTTVEEKKAVWGPHTAALSPNTWRLTVNQTGDHHYTYVLEARAKSGTDADFKTILSGSHQVAVDANGARTKNFGKGNFTLDWDAAQTLPEHDNNVGRVEVRYLRPDSASMVTVDADFRQVRDGENPAARVNADYRYKSTPGSGGEFDFAVKKNVDRGTTRTAAENLTIKSRWKQDGAGRSDIQATGGDLGTVKAQVNECWDTNFASQVLLVSYAPAANYGTEATECAFPSAVYSTLTP
jgi:hypothetical protein